MMKMKKTCKKAKGLKIRLEKEKFLDQLKNPQKYAPKPLSEDHAADILRRIRNRRKKQYDPSTASVMTKIRRLAGLE